MTHGAQKSKRHGLTRTYLGRAILRRAFRLRQLAFPSLAAVAVVVAAVAAGTAAHHVEGVVRVRVRRAGDGGVDIMGARGVGGHVAVAMGEVLLLLRRLEVRVLLLLLLRLVRVRSVNDCGELRSQIWEEARGHVSGMAMERKRTLEGWTVGEVVRVMQHAGREMDGHGASLDV